MKYIFTLFLLLTALVFPKGILADAYSQGEVNYAVSIDKKIRPINDISYYDNIGKDQKIFVTDDVMDYNVLIENTGKDILYNLVVKDYFPVVNQIILAPGEIDKKNRQIFWKIDSLAVGETKNYTVRAKITNCGSSVAQTNVVQVSNNNVFDRDTATFYTGCKTIPSTGNNDLWIKTSLILSFSLIALILRKVARGY